MIPRGGKTEMNDELEALVVSKKELDRKLLADILSPYVRLDRDDCDIDTLEAWLGLGTDLKILVYLLARKAMVALGFDLGVEGATAREVALVINVNHETVGPELKKMRAEGILEETKDYRYFVPNHAVVRVKGMISTR